MTRLSEKKYLKEILLVDEISTLLSDYRQHKVDKKKRIDFIRKMENDIKRYEELLIRLRAPYDVEIDEVLAKCYYLFGTDMSWEFRENNTGVKSWIDIEKRLKAAEIVNEIADTKYELDGEKRMCNTIDYYMSDIRSEIKKLLV